MGIRNACLCIPRRWWWRDNDVLKIFTVSFLCFSVVVVVVVGENTASFSTAQEAAWDIMVPELLPCHTSLLCFLGAFNWCRSPWRS